MTAVSAIAFVTMVVRGSGLAAERYAPIVQESKMELTDADNGKEVDITPNSTLSIKLAAQFGTGYSWEVEEINKDLLSTIGKPTVETINKDGVGRRELQVFSFKPMKSGTSVIKLRYVRPWEKPAKPQKSYSVTVTIK